MNGKVAKKIRRDFRRGYEQDMHELAQAHYKFLKTKPKWVPMWLWIFGLSFFVKIK